MPTRPSITLVGRASRLRCHSGHVSFLLTVKGKGQRPDLVVECQAHREADIEAFETMDEGSLVGVIGKLQTLDEQLAHCIVRLDRLEILGKPLQEAA
ncbi:MAG: hypothetical protein RLZZ611_353 [Cyanobacteriota bacterium]|jgi:lysyl-tRNA synthetase class II